MSCKNDVLDGDTSSLIHDAWNDRPIHLVEKAFTHGSTVDQAICAAHQAMLEANKRKREDVVTRWQHVLLTCYVLRREFEQKK